MIEAKAGTASVKGTIRRTSRNARDIMSRSAAAKPRAAYAATGPVRLDLKASKSESNPKLSSTLRTTMTTFARDSMIFTVQHPAWMCSGPRSTVVPDEGWVTFPELSTYADDVVR